MTDEAWNDLRAAKIEPVPGMLLTWSMPGSGLPDLSYRHHKALRRYRANDDAEYFPDPRDRATFLLLLDGLTKTLNEREHHEYTWEVEQSGWSIGEVVKEPGREICGVFADGDFGVEGIGALCKALRETAPA